ncbi:MAG: lysylphosphatidylglycerol synthase domain-containing protein [Gammaproteobacteria bacterium]|nr:lysylphosphatidylglycerol synthase domain-containing protein [Gammaproteobacteria bacterium]
MASERKKRFLPWLQRLLILGFLGYIGYLAAGQFQQLDWHQVTVAVRTYGVQGIAVAAIIALPGLAACACFDLIGRRLVGHHLSVPRTMLISFTGYFFSLNLGALAGGLAFRYRLYSANGLKFGRISSIVGQTIVTNWLGYILLAGAVLTFAPPELPDGWGPGRVALIGIGVSCLATSAAYVLVCFIASGTEVKFSGLVLRLPPPRMVFVQYALSLTSWGSITALLVWLIPGDAGPMVVLPVLMISAIAGIWSHVPGGIGVIEVVFLRLLSDRVPDNELVAAVLVFRAVYYLVPFLLAIPGYLYLEKTRVAPPDDTAD